ncbi:MAG: glycosyltransferase family 2 protein [Gemmataceae bacterium]
MPTTPAFTPETGVELSVVIPLYNEEDNILELYRRLTSAMDLLGLAYELVLVNDGSSDRTSALLRQVQEEDFRVVVLSLSRNFGHQAAITAGLDCARGEAVVVMDGDLQDPPEVLGEFVETWQQGYDVVYAIRTKRKENVVKRAAYALFYRILRASSDLEIPLDSGDFCLMDRKVVEALKRLPEKQRFVRGLRTYVGFKQTGLRYERSARHAGTPKYTLAALSRLAMDGFFNFSCLPLQVVRWMAAICVFLFAILLAWQGVESCLRGTLPAGWSLTCLVVLLVGSGQLVGLAIVGEYVRRIFQELKGRPSYFVDERATEGILRRSRDQQKQAA